jgi:hypothetical protein
VLTDEAAKMLESLKRLTSSICFHKCRLKAFRGFK